MFTQNVGETDRAFRIVGGVLLLLYAVISLTGTTQAVVAIFSLASVVTGMLGYSVLYAMVGVKTSPVPVKKAVKKAVAKKSASPKKPASTAKKARKK